MFIIEKPHYYFTHIYTHINSVMEGRYYNKILERKQ